MVSFKEILKYACELSFIELPIHVLINFKDNNLKINYEYDQ